jgi:hypothetical protein
MLISEFRVISDSHLAAGRGSLGVEPSRFDSQVGTANSDRSSA